MTSPTAADRLYRHTRREALVVMLVWLLALAWTVGYCYLFGYQHDPQDWLVRAGLAPVRGGDELTLIAGLPDWVFLGIVAPWLACTLVTIGFAVFVMEDDDLGAEAGEAPPPAAGDAFPHLPSTSSEHIREGQRPPGGPGDAV